VPEVPSAPDVPEVPELPSAPCAPPKLTSHSEYVPEPLVVAILPVIAPVPMLYESTTPSIVYAELDAITSD